MARTEAWTGSRTGMSWQGREYSQWIEDPSSARFSAGQKILAERGARGLTVIVRVPGQTADKELGGHIVENAGTEGSERSNGCCQKTS